MAKVFDFSEAFKDKHYKHVSHGMLAQMREAHTYYVSETTIYTEPIGSSEEETLTAVVSSETCSVRVYQPVRADMTVEDRIIMSFGNLLLLEFSSSLITTILLDLKGSLGSSTIDINQKSLHLRGSELYRVVSEATKILGARNLLGYCGFEFRDEKDDPEQDPSDDFWFDV